MICNRCSAKLTNDNWSKSWRKSNQRCCLSCSKENNTSTNPDRMYVNGKYIKKSHPLHKAGKYTSFDDLAFSSLKNYMQVKEGYVYAISNPAWPEWVKIGKAIDADDRLGSYQTSSPMRDYRLIHSVYFDDRNQAEHKAHKLAAAKSSQAWNKDLNGEWFYLTDEQAIQVLKDTTDES